MYFHAIFVFCTLSFFVKAEINETPPVEVMQSPWGTDVFCFFAYSRWAKPSYIHERFPRADRVGVARLPYHRLDFKYYLQEAKGSISTIVPDCGYEVWGAIYYIPMQDLDLVLTKGGVDDNKRIFHFVQNTVEAYFYEGNLEPINLQCNSFQQIDLPEKLIYGLPLQENQRPSKQILDVMIEAYTDAGLPKKYIEEVSQLPVRSEDVSTPVQLNSS